MTPTLSVPGTVYRAVAPLFESLGNSVGTFGTLSWIERTIGYGISQADLRRRTRKSGELKLKPELPRTPIRLDCRDRHDQERKYA